MNAIVAVRFLQPVDLRPLNSREGETREVVLSNPRDRYTTGSVDLVVETHPLGLKIRSKHENKDGTRPNHSVIVPFANIASVTEGYFGESKPVAQPKPASPPPMEAPPWEEEDLYPRGPRPVSCDPGPWGK